MIDQSGEPICPPGNENEFLDRVICPPTYEEINGKCFKYVPVKMTYLEALASCINIGAKLAEPKSQLEFDGLVAKWPDYFWLGINDIVQEGRKY